MCSSDLTVRLPQVLQWLANHESENRIDVLALQETKTTDDKFPHAAIEDAGYQVACFGQKTYNGVALLTRQPVEDLVLNIPGFEDEMARVITGTVHGIRMVGAYFPNGQAPGSEKFVYKMAWLHALRDWLEQELVRYPKLVLMGDFNITFDDRDVWDPVGLAGTIHCTDEERTQLQQLTNLGLVEIGRAHV